MTKGDSYSQVITGANYTSLFTSPEMNALENNCAKLLLYAIFELIRAGAVATAPEYLDFIISGMKTRLPITFTDMDGIRTYIPHSCGETIGLAHITDLLTMTAEDTIDRYALIKFNINQLYFQLDGFIPENMKLIAFTRFLPYWHQLHLLPLHPAPHQAPVQELVQS